MTTLHKYWKTAAIAAAGHVGDSPLFLLGYGMAVGGLLDTFFSFNVLHISRRLGAVDADDGRIDPTLSFHHHPASSTGTAPDREMSVPGTSHRPVENFSAKQLILF